jgi:hypothetical protein
VFAAALAGRLDRRRCELAATAGQGACSALLALQALFGTFPVGVVSTPHGDASCSTSARPRPVTASVP